MHPGAPSFPTLDQAASLGLGAFTAGFVVAYGVRRALQGAARSARADKDGGSALLGKWVIEGFYWGLGPVVRLCVRLGVTPDVITWTSLLLGGASGVLLALGHPGVAGVVGVVSALGDGIDGQVARASHSASDAGEVLDAAVDRCTEFAVLAGAAVWFREDAMALTVCLLALLASFMVSYATAKAEALQMEVPRGLFRRGERTVLVLNGCLFTPLLAPGCLALGLPAATPLLGALAVLATAGNVSWARRMAALARGIRAREAAASRLAPVEAVSRTSIEAGGKRSLPVIEQRKAG